MEDNSEILDQYAAEADAGVSFGGLFSALSIFFVGLLITNYESFPSFIRIPLLFLVISTFGFVYATLIYANSTSKLNSKNLKSCRKAIDTADILGEFMGTYPLLISIPLVIPIVTNDTFLISAVFISDVLGMIIYHISGFSIVENYFKKGQVILVIVLVASMTSMMVLLQSTHQNAVMVLASLTITFLIATSLLSIRSLSS